MLCEASIKALLLLLLINRPGFVVFEVGAFPEVVPRDNSSLQPALEVVVVFLFGWCPEYFAQGRHPGEDHIFYFGRAADVLGPEVGLCTDDILVELLLAQSGRYRFKGLHRIEWVVTVNGQAVLRVLRLVMVEV